MSTLQGKVLNFQKDINIQGRSGSYVGYRLVLQTPDGQVKPIEKAMQSLKYTPSVEAALSALQVGDDVTVYLEKNDKGFLDVKAVTKGDETPPASALSNVPSNQASSAPASRAGYTGKVVGSTYETPEERKLKQRLIVRQSAIATAERMLQNEPLSNIIGAAEKIEEWVYRGLE